MVYHVADWLWDNRTKHRIKERFVAFEKKYGKNGWWNFGNYMCYYMSRGQHKKIYNDIPSKVKWHGGLGKRPKKNKKVLSS